MQRLQFNINIHAPVAIVYNRMLGIDNKLTYEQWTALFNPTSTYEGDWNKGSKMLFVGVDEEGRKSGMVSMIVENIPNQFVSIQHKGELKANEEVTSGPDVDKWANGFENYTFAANDNSTNLTVDLDTVEECLDFMNDVYPKALEKLKEICEQ